MALLKIFHNQFEQQSKLLYDLVIFLEDVFQCQHKRIMCFYGEECDGFLCDSSCDNIATILSQLMEHQMHLKLFKQ